MLTPQKIQDLAEPVEEIYQHITDELLVNIGKHIRAPTWTHTSAWEVQKLSELGQLTAENAAIINKWIKEIPEATREAMTETRRAALGDLERQMEAAVAAGKIAPPVADSTVNAFRDAIAQAETRYNLVNSTMLESSLQAYTQAINDTARSVADAAEMQLQLQGQAEATQRILNDAAVAVSVGTKTRDAAMRDALRRISAQGLTGFVDRAGRSWSPEAYVNMVTRTTVHNMAISARRSFGEDYGTSVFQVSSHAGARPGCYPYQGKFYSWDNSEGEIILGDGKVVRYEGLNRTTYGQPAGLFGRHICRIKTSLTPLLRGVRTTTVNAGNGVECSR